VSSAAWGFTGVVAGGLLTVLGQTAAELLKSRVASRERRERRQQLAREHQRETIVLLFAALAGYRKALNRDRSLTIPTPQSEAELTSARVAYQAVVHRVSDQAARSAVQAWESEALLWFQRDDEGRAERESSTWDVAMKALGEANRATE